MRSLKFLALIGVIGVAYNFGLLNTLGIEYDHIVQVGDERHGDKWWIGLPRFYFFEGQKLVVDYDVQVDGGQFVIGMEKTYGVGGYGNPEVQAVIREDGQGRVVLEGPRGSLYSIYFRGEPVYRGNSYDITYDVTWGMELADD